MQNSPIIRNERLGDFNYNWLVAYADTIDKPGICTSIAKVR